MLAYPHLGIGAALRQKLLMLAVLDHAAVLEHQNLVGLDYGRQGDGR